MVDVSPARSLTAELVSYVPRLTIEWLRDDPESLWREVDGTIAFIDISGFTAMSERLSSRGRAGAEEVTEVMNATFAALLAVAYAQGGGLLKFGGDALLLLFEGDDHARRAARAAFEMRRTLRAIGRPRTSAGAIQLKMHAGLHAGRFHFFLVGDSHRELLVTGPAATRTVEMEAASEAGEILLSTKAAELVEPETLGEEKEEGRLLRAAPDVQGTVEPLPSIDDLSLEIAVPAPLRSQLLEVGPLEGEHRHAAIAFIRFSGTDEVIATEGPEAAADALDLLVRTVQAAADEHRVTFLESDIDQDGARIVLVSGAPQTFGDDEERVLRTVRAVVDAGLPLPVRIGVSEGRVFTGQVGASFRRTYTVLGDTAALAARLMARAGEDEVWVSSTAFARGGARFSATELEPFQVKGKSEPVRAVVLGELTPETALAEHEAVQLPFVDRERERAVLAASVAPVRMGFGTLVELVGEPGIGKSRLADELRENCSDMRHLALRCEQYESATAYFPFRPFLRSILDVDLNGGAAHNRAVLTERLRAVDEDLVPWAPLLAAPLDVEVESTSEVDDLDPSFRRARLHGVVGSLLGQLLNSPTLFLFEDVHWMDDASSELLRHLGTQLPTRPWLACTTRRGVGGGFAAAEGTPPLPALTLRLEPLPADDAKTLVRAAAGDRRLTEDELATLMERGAGNPLFLQELASPGEPTDAAEQMPDTVEGLVATRIDRLAPGDRALLRWASVLGVSFSGELIAHVLEGDPTAASDSEAWDRLAEFVERDPDVPGAFRFRHALIRDGAYEGLSYKRRRELHGRVADVVEAQLGDRADDSAELLSLHYERAGNSAKSWQYSLAAGERAQAKWANSEAVEFYRRAIDAAPAVPELDSLEIARVWRAIGECLHLLGELDEAGRAFTAARELTPRDTPEQIELMSKQGLLRDEMGRYADALRWYTRGLKATEALADEDDRRRLRIRLRLAHAQARYRQGAFKDCIRRLKEVVQECLEADDSANLATAYLLLHLVHSQLGSPDRAAYRGLALALYEDLGDLKGQASALNNFGIDLYYEGDWENALDRYEEGRKLYARIGDAPNVGVTTNNIGEILSDQGRVEEAEALFAEVAKSAEVMGHRFLVLLAHSNLGRAAGRTGRFTEAEEQLSHALEVAREMGASSFVLEVEARMAELDALRGDRPESALTWVEAVLERSGEAGGMAPVEAAAQRTRAAALFQLGEPGRAREALEDSLRIARAAEARYELALSLDVLGATGDEAAAQESVELFERLGVTRVTRPPLG